MKVILTGATGFVGGEVFEQCVAHPDITAILVLSRRALTSPSASNSKVSTVILQDFMKYPDSVLKEMKDADICIWSLGVYNGDEEVEVGYPLAFCKAMSSVRAEEPTKPFRMVYLSGILVITDQNASIWFMPKARKAKGRVETKLLAFSEEQNSSGRSWESYVVRPGGIFPKNRGRIVTAVIGNSFLLHVDELAAAMIEIALKGDAERRVWHANLVKKGKELLLLQSTRS